MLLLEFYPIPHWDRCIFLIVDISSYGTLNGVAHIALFFTIVLDLLEGRRRLLDELSGCVFSSCLFEALTWFWCFIIRYFKCSTS